MITGKRIQLIGCPVGEGAGQPGCAMGSAALRIAKIQNELQELGHEVIDSGDLEALSVEEIDLPGKARNVPTIAGWTRSIFKASCQSLEQGYMPVFMGGDHSLSMGSVAGAAQYAAQVGRPLCVLWLDAHSDFNTPITSPSGNMHGMPVAFFCGESGFDGILPTELSKVNPENVFMFGIRSVDSIERKLVSSRGIKIYDMRVIDEFGTSKIIQKIIEEIKGINAMLHVSLDVDFLDPSIAPGVGTTVPGGATFREAHLALEILHESDLVTSLDLVELNPYLDDRGKSARMLVGLTTSLFGQKIIDKTSTII